MTPPLFLPFAPADQEHLASVVVPREWPDAARAHGVDAERVKACATEHVGGSVSLYWYMPGPQGGVPGSGVLLALRSLAEALEGLGYAVAWEPSPRVVGWAVVEEWERPGKTVLVRIIDLPPSDRRVKARDDALFAAREARRGPGPAADAKHVGAVTRNEAAYPRRAGR